MFFIYASEFQEEAPMDNKHYWKRENETFTCSPTLIYMTSYREVISSKRDPERKISSMKIGGDILIGGVTLLSKGERERTKAWKHRERIDA
jgi:hypothetical protein